MRALALSILFSAAGSLLAAEPYLALPIDCDPGRSCFIEDYVDADPGAGSRDYTCGLKSRDGHRGTDIALLDFAAMDAGVNVLAAADGVVEAVRDGMADIAVTPDTRADIAGRECGNAVRLRHANGDQTLYCHLQNGSVSVQPGDRVSQGAPLGRVGLSGLTNYPHVHLTVLRNGRVIDPFAPNAQAGTCGLPTEATLWRNPLPYTPTGLFTAGFSTSVPAFDDVSSGAARVQETGPMSPLVLYGHVFEAQPGDRITLSAAGPQGEIFERSETLDDPQRNLFRAFGRRAPQSGWPPGAYRGYVTLMRGETVIAVRHADVTVR